MNRHLIQFPDSGYADLHIAAGERLSLHLTAGNSPLLFGCRAGLCGTCLIEVEAIGNGTLAPPSADEQEALAVYAPDHAHARLACQLCVTADLRIRRL